MADETKARAGRQRDETLVARRQEEILGAAALFFAEFGYRQSDVQVLADRLGVGKGTVYRYFPTKEALFFGAVDAGMQALTDCVDEAVGDEVDPVRHIEKAVRAYLGFFDEHSHLIELLIIERAEFRGRKEGTYFIYKKRNEAKRIGFIEDAIRRGVIRDIPVDTIMRVIGDTLYGAIFTNHFANRNVPFDEQANEILDVVFNGILTDRK